MNRQFNSIFKSEMEAFMNYKKNCGYRCSTHVYNKYLRLDQYFTTINLQEKVIDQKIIDGWLQLFDKCKKSHKFMNGLSVMKSFTKYLIQNNYKNILIPEIPIKSVSFIPHIYTNSEIKQIFEYANYLKEHNSSCKNYDAYYVILCILFGCGLRISEAIHLTIKDVNISEKTLTIIKSKNNISRCLPMSDSVFNILVDYLNHHEYQNENSQIFLNNFSNTTRSKFVNTYGFRWYFHMILKHIKISSTYEGKLPRVHDIRHTFAIKALEQMENKNMDLYTSISILSVYLGHVSIVETEKYLRLVPTATKKVNERIKNYASNIYDKKEEYYEE